MESIKCKNCNSPYSVKFPVDGKRRVSLSSQRIPLLLECGHSYCSQCLQKMSHLQSSDLPCPQCRYQTPFTRGTNIVTQLPLSYYLFGQVVASLLGIKCGYTLPVVAKSQFVNEWAEFDDKEQSSDSNQSVILISCEECEERRAEYECLKCDCKLCLQCFDQIHASKVLRTHLKSPLEPAAAKMEQSQLSQLRTALPQAESHQQTLLVTLSNLNSILSRLNDLKGKDRRADLMQLCQVRINKAEGQYLREIDSQELIFNDFKSNLIKILSEKRTAIKKSSTLLQTNDKVDNFDELLQQLNSPIDDMLQALPEARYPCIILDREALQRSLEEVYRVSTEIPISDVNDVVGSKEKEEVEEEEEEEEEEALSLLSLSPLHVNDSLIEPGVTDLVNGEGGGEGGRTERLSTPFDSGSSKNTSFLSPVKVTPNRTSSASVTSSVSSRGSSPGLESFNTKVTPDEMSDADSVMVTHVESPTDFYIQYVKDIPALAELNETIKKYPLTNVKEVEPNITCVVLCNDDDYKRCLVESLLEPSYAYIQLIDYGHSEMVSVKSLYCLPPKLRDVPLFSQKCQLEGIKPLSSGSSTYLISPNEWSQSSKSYFKSIAEGQKGLKMKILSQEGKVLIVDLFMPSNTGGLSVARQLVLQGKASRERKKKQQHQIIINDLPPVEPLPVGSTHRVAMVTAGTPHDFYVQLASDELERRLHSINTHKIKEIIALPRDKRVHYQIGSLVLAPYENEYFRAKVIDKSKRNFKVLFVDYGNTATINKKMLYPLDDPALLGIPPMSYHCRLIDVTWTDDNDNWPEDVCEWFHETAIDLKKNLFMTIAPAVRTEQDIIPVTLKDDTLQNIGQLMVIQSIARRVPLLPQVLPSRQLPTPGTSELGIVTHVDSPTKFHIHLSSCLTKLRQMESLFDNLPPPPPSYMPIPLDHCLALFPADHRYHRARIESVAEGKVGVFFVDYGNRLDIDVGGVVPMLGACLVLPEMALPCLLDGFGVEEEVVGRGEGVVCWSYEHCMEFCQLVLEKEVMVTIKKVVTFNDSPLLVVDLLVKTSPQEELVNVLSLLPAVRSKLVTMTTQSLPASSNGPMLSQVAMETDLLSPFAAFTSMPTLTQPEVAMTTQFSPPSWDSSLSQSPQLNSTYSKKTSSGRKSKLDIPGRKAPSASVRKKMYSKGVWPQSPFQAIITSVNENGHIYGQPLANGKYLDEVQTALKEITSTHPPVTGTDAVYPLMSCVAMYTVDNNWYRGVVMSVTKEERKANVQFVDYGNMEDVSFDNIIDVVAAEHIPIIVLKLMKCTEYPLPVLEELIDKVVIVSKTTDDINILMEDGKTIKTFLSLLAKPQ